MKFQLQRQTLPLLLLWLLLLAAFLNFFHYSLSLVLYPYEWDSFEGYHVYQAWRFCVGAPLYKNPDIYPLLIANYPPVFFVLGGALQFLFGLAFWPLRLLGLMSGLGTGWLIYLVLRRERVPGFWASTSALLFFVSPVSAAYAIPLARVDSLALAFSLAALYFFRASPASFPALAGAGLFSLLAVYTKQTAITAVAAGWCWLLAQSPRRALVLLLTTAALGGAVFWLLERGSGGEFYRQMFLLNLGRRDPGRMAGMFLNFLGRWGIFFAGAVIAAFAGGEKARLWRLFFLFSLLNAVFGIRHGATSAYYLPVVASSAILLGIQAPRLAGFLAASGRGGRALWCLLILAVLGTLAANREGYVRPVSADREKMALYRAAFSRIPGEILTFQMHSLAFLDGREVFIFPTSLESTTGFRGLESSPFFRDLEEGRFAGALDSRYHSFLGPAVREALEKRYRPESSLVLPCHRPGGDEFVLWVPK